MNHKKGFTLIELLIVIAILVVLSVVVVLTLNPAEILRQGRDSTRLSDLATYKSAIALYLADVVALPANALGDPANCYYYDVLPVVHTAVAVLCGGRFLGGTNTAAQSQAVAGAGWLPVAFSAISSGSPIASEPIDPVPVPTAGAYTYYYAHRATGNTGLNALTYEINAALESTKYTAAPNNILANDGGNNATLYEIGTYPGLAL